MSVERGINGELEFIFEDLDSKISSAFTKVEKYIKSLLHLKNIALSSQQTTATQSDRLFNTSSKESSAKSCNTEKGLFDSTTEKVSAKVSDATTCNEDFTNYYTENFEMSYSSSLRLLTSLDTRLLGEIAFQLDRRIVMHVFDDKVEKVNILILLLWSCAPIHRLLLLCLLSLQFIFSKLLQ